MNTTLNSHTYGEMIKCEKSTDSALATFSDCSISDVEPFMIHAMPRIWSCQQILLLTNSNSTTQQAVRFKKTHERQVFWIFRNHFSVNSATAELPWRSPTAVSHGHPLSLRPQIVASQMPGWRVPPAFPRSAKTVHTKMA